MNRFFTPLSIIAISFFYFQNGSAQGINSATLLFGEENVEVGFSTGISALNNTRIALIYDTKLVLALTVKESGGIKDYLYSYTAGKETTITSAKLKTDDRTIILITLSDGSVVKARYDANSGRFKTRDRIKPDVNLSGAKKIIGDAVYVLKQGKIYASWDTAKTWSLDSINIGAQTVQDVTVDTNNYGWVITQNRNLYYQHPDSNIWHKDTSFTTTGFPYAIFVDRKGRMFISSSSSEDRVQMSTDGGASWINLSTGIDETILSFGDDAFGNIYAVGQGSHAYRLSNLTPPWESISDSINGQAYLPSSAKIINSISGDSILFAATIYGMFQSTDFGVNWKHAPNTLQSPAHIFYTGVMKAGNYYFLSTNLGVYRVAAGDTTWEKVFPKQGYIYGVNAFTADSVGNLYGNLPLKTGPSSWLFYTVTSTDHGDTWIPDTAGQKALGINSGTQIFDYFVTQQGEQYLGGNGVLFSKKPGQNWKRDTAGLGMKGGEYIADVSRNNKTGAVYAGRRTGSFPTYSFALCQRGIGDSVWHRVNTDTLAATEARLISDHQGNIIVRTIGFPYKIWKYDGSSWSEIPLPTALGAGSFPQVLTVDKNGVLWGAFFAGVRNRGVYYTSDNGTTWKYAGLDSVGVNFLTAVEEPSGAAFMKSSGSSSSTVYAVTYIDGVYGFKAEEPTSIQYNKPEIAQSFRLYQNYPNPFNPSTEIRYQVPDVSRVTLTVYDILGREVVTLVNEEMKAGLYSARFDASRLSTGIYIYTLRAGTYTASKKLLLMK